MLRPKQMSKISVTGSKAVMDDVIEAVHDMGLLHLTDYDGSWDGFGQGDPITGADEASEKLVTVRSIESILDVENDDAGPRRIVTDEALEEELEDVRREVNELDDRRAEIESELRRVEEEHEAMQPFAELGIDLDLLSGYDSLQVVVGEGRREEVRRSLVDADPVSQFEIFPRDADRGVLAVFAAPSDGADDSALADSLVGSEFTALSIPDAEGSPEEYLRQLEHRTQKLEAKLETVEDELENVKLDAAGFLLAAEETLAIEVQKTEAPLSFATTENAFVAEGWIPSERYTELASAIKDAVGDRVDVEELERATFKSNGDAHHEAAADGGTVMSDDEPPVVQDNPGFIKPFELLVEAVNRPKYSEFDPTIFLFLTFPAFFGFMIGDFGYGLLYTAIGYYLYSSFDSPAFKSMGGITLFAGGFTMLFGFLYGEIFGLHLITEFVWGGTPPIEKGLSPATLEWALTWLTVSVLVGVLHLNVGWITDFVENYQLHDVKHAVFESGSWLLMMNGLWVWIFSEHLASGKPAFLFETFAAGGTLPLGFAGFPAGVGIAGLAAFFVGLGLLVVGEPIEAVEFLNVLVNVLSYARLAAVLLAKAGMAFTVNLLVFGAYRAETEHGVEFHFAWGHSIEHVEHTAEFTGWFFKGLFHPEFAGIAGFLGGLALLVLGHALVLALGVTSAGLQAVRLEYVEFFNKFFDGGGRAYDPFGYERQYTTED